MSDDTQEIKRLIKQIEEFGESLVRLARKLEKQNLQRSQNYRTDAANLVAPQKNETGERSYREVVSRQADLQADYDSDYAKVRRAVLDGTMTPQEAALDLLCGAVADKTMTPNEAASEIAKLLRPDLPVSQRIAIREDLKAALAGGDDVASRIRPLLKNSIQQAEQRKKVRECRLALGGMNPI
jgi:hypothetical protein